MINPENFTAALNKLNAEQRKAVTTIEGPVMVVAGPGTGKTQILTLRMAEILRQTDSAPEQILALTFTDSGARAMRARLTSFIGATAYRVPIHTFHSFAAQLIARYPDSYPKIIGGRPATPVEKIELMESCLASGNYSVLRPPRDHNYHVKAILSALADLKKEYCSPDRFATLLAEQAKTFMTLSKWHEKGAHQGKVRSDYLKAEKDLRRNQELLLLYRSYEALLKDKHWFDFEDMIIDTVDTLKTNETMLRDVQEQYLYVLADEHQDVNQSQNELLEVITNYHPSPNLFVVGDEKQAIYRFQGASLDNFLYFTNQHANATVIPLTQNYRSTQAILDAAHALVMTDDSVLKSLRVPLNANTKDAGELRWLEFAHENLENHWLTEQVASLKAGGLSYRELAVIVRTNQEVATLTEVFRGAQLPVFASSEKDLLEHPILLAMIDLIVVATNPKAEEALAAVLHQPYVGLVAADVGLILAARGRAGTLWQICSSADRLKEIGVKKAVELENFMKSLEAVSKLALTATPVEHLAALLSQTNFTDAVVRQDPVYGAAFIRRIYDECLGWVKAGRIKRLPDIVVEFDRYRRHGLSLSATETIGTAEGVSIMTVHQAKGLEFDTVLIPHLTDRIWGSGGRSSIFKLPLKQISLNKEVALDDERRLLYVALTRAKRRLICSYANTALDGKEQSPARFMLDIKAHFTSEEIATDQTAFNPVSVLVPVKRPTVSGELLKDHLRHHGWSATSLNNYLKSPWEYIYRNVLRYPEPKTKDLEFGSLVHSLIEALTRRLITGEVVTESQILQLIRIKVDSLGLSAVDAVNFSKRAEAAVVGYWAELKSVVTPTARVELPVEAELGVALKDCPTVRLTGKFDRVDFDADGYIKQVIDYKTGQAKTRGEIMGKTKDSTGNQYRQLIFYALLLSLQNEPKWACRQGSLIYLEPDERGRQRSESFLIEPEEIAQLATVIRQATEEVVSGSCLNQPCDPKVSSFCRLLN